jgi:hypothetical protein
VKIKAAEKTCRSRFHYRGFQQYGTDKAEYDDITDCVVTVLQARADKKAKDREESA